MANVPNFRTLADRITTHEAHIWDDGIEKSRELTLHRKASITYVHTANDTGVIPIFRAEADCEIIAAHVRPETGWTAGAASEDLYLVRDDGDQGNTKNIAWIDGTAQDMDADRNNEWTDATNGLPGVYAPPLDPPIDGEIQYAKIPAGWYLYLQQTTNGAGATMGNVLIEITYRLQ